ncbi:MAG: hypothetical protein LBD55_05420 [Treponema sp.]|jgi:endo-1,4-beta-xylanase|nr:hypothetical protein [Treponema sp.]
MKKSKYLSGMCGLALTFALIFSGCPTESGGDPDLTGSVSITGTPQVGQILTANTGSLDGNGTIKYQWNTRSTAGGVDGAISGATGATYMPVTGDAGKFLTITVTREGYNGSVTSSATAAVTPAPVSTVTGVTVSPAAANVAKDGIQVFTATVIGTNSPAQTVTWSILGIHAERTAIVDGTLTVAADETAETFKVRATSTADPSKYGDAAVTITGGPFVAVTDITGVPETATTGTPLTLTAAVTPDNATNKTIVWRVKNGAASISGNALNAAAAGDVTVTATIADGTARGADFTKDFTITVTAPLVAVTEITGEPETATTGTPLTLTAAVTPDNATNKTVAWSVKSGAASISGNALTAAAAGNVTVTATIADGTARGADFTKDFTITVTGSGNSENEDIPTPAPTVTGVTVSPATAGIARGETHQFTATVTGENDPAQTVTWIIVETNKAAGTTINGSGVLTIAVNEPLTGLTVKAASTADPSKSGTAAVSVTGDPPVLTGTVTIGGTAKVGEILTAAIGDSNGSGAPTFRWIRGDSVNIGSNQAAYIPVTDDIGFSIKVEVTYPGFAGEILSSATELVSPPTFDVIIY